MRLSTLGLAMAALCLATLALSAGDPPSRTPQPPLLLTQFDIIQMSQQGLAPDAIVAKLRQAGSAFALTPSDVAILRVSGVDTMVIQAMMQRPPEPAPRPRGSVVPAAGLQPPAGVEYQGRYSHTIRPEIMVPFAAQPMNGSGRTAGFSRPVGNWVREAGPLTIHLLMTNDRIIAEATVAEDGETMTVSLDADYSVNPEGLIYGVITGIDCTSPKMASELQQLAGHTFSLRCRVDGDAMSVREVKFAGSGLDDPSDVGGMALMAAGRYRKDDGRTTRPEAPTVMPVGNLEPQPPLPPGDGRLRNLGVGQAAAQSNRDRKKAWSREFEEYRDRGEFWRGFWFDGPEVAPSPRSGDWSPFAH